MAKRIVKGEHSWPCIMCVRYWRLVDTVLERSPGSLFVFFFKTAAVILTVVLHTCWHLQPRGNPISPALVSWGLKRPWHAFAVFRGPLPPPGEQAWVNWWRMYGDCVGAEMAISAPGALDWPSTWPSDTWVNPPETGTAQLSPASVESQNHELNQYLVLLTTKFPGYSLYGNS